MCPWFLGEGSSVRSVYTAGNLFVIKFVSSVVDGDTTVRLGSVSLGPDCEGFGGGEDGTGQLVTQHLPAVSLLRVLLGQIIKMLTPRNVEIVVVALKIPN